jgi:hypothetical protein
VRYSASLPAILLLAVHCRSRQHTDSTAHELGLVIPPQPVRAEPAFAAVIDSSDRTFANHGGSDQSINILDRLYPCPDNIHPLTIPDAAGILNRLNYL